MRRRGGGSERLLATVMFTDVVGSTELAGRLGDRAWKGLMARHNAIVRRELKRFSGRELDTAGDGFFVMFGRPAQAIDCAWATIDALRPLDLQIRAAIHMGEVEVMDRKVGGIAVHVASRALGLAGPGQIYVTSIVHDVVAGGDTRFADKGIHELRGVPGEWRLYEVEQPATDRAIPIEESADLATGRQVDPRVIAGGAVAGALIAVIVVLAFAFATGSRPAPLVPHADSLLRVDAASNAFRQSVDVRDPTGIAVADGAVWVLSLSGRTLNRVDLESLSITAIGLPTAPTGLAAAEGSIWLTTGFGSPSNAGVMRVGTLSRRVDQVIPLGSGADGIAADEASVWVTNRVNNSLSRIDLTSQAAAGEMQVDEQPEAVIVGEGSIWVASVVDRTVWRIDPATLTMINQITLAEVPFDLALGFGRLWISSAVGNSVMVVDVATNSIQRTIPMAGPARGIAAGPDAVWVAIATGELAKLDPNDLANVIYIPLASAPEDVAVSEGSVWVSIRE